MQAMNLHTAQQDVLLNLLNVQPGKAQGSGKMPQGEMSFSSMLERADKTYSTEGKYTQKPQETSPKTESSAKKEDEPREISSVKNDRKDEPAQKTTQRDEVKSEEKTEAFDTERAEAEISRFTEKSTEIVSDVLVEEDTAENACLTMPDSDEITETEPGKAVVENGLSSTVEVSVKEADALVLENTEMADKKGLSAQLETKPVTDADKAAETEKAASDKVETETLSSEKKTKKKDALSGENEAARLVMADDAVKAQQVLPDAESTVLAAVHAKADASGAQESKIEIIDERTQSEPAEPVLTTTTTLNADNSSAEMVMTLPVQDAGADANGSLEAGYTKADFSQMLSNSLASTKDEFVKTGSIILQDNKKGSINLILRPEELGNVKVKLELSDNQITGKIVVASKEAYEAFKSNLEDIRNAFVANGFDACGFDLAWAGAGDSNGSQSQNSADNGSMNQFGMQYYGTAYEDNIPDSVPEYYAENTHINLVA